MRFLTSGKGCTRLDKIRNECMRKESEVFSMNNRITKYKQDWREHVESMEEERVVKQALWYRHKEEEILMDHEEGRVMEAGRGHRPNLRIGGGR
jgi:hypothetical protein